MRLKKQPHPPKRKVDIRDRFGSVDFDDMPIDGLADHVMQQIKSGHYDLFFKMSGLTVEAYKGFYLHDDFCRDGCYIEVYGLRDETDAEFNKRLDSYNKRKTEYDAWYKANKKEIEAELKSREDGLTAKKRREIEQLESKLKRLKNG